MVCISWDIVVLAVSVIIFGLSHKVSNPSILNSQDLH